MAMPSVLTLGSAAFVVAAGIGLVSVSSSATEQAAGDPRSIVQEPVPTRDPAVREPVEKPVDKPIKKPEKPRHRSRDVIPKTLVDVYNNSGVSGLAAAKSAILQGAGWNVATTDNWYGEIVDSTVYFPASRRDEAKQLARTLRITRLRPAVTPMQFDRLTVIFTTA